MSTAPAAKYRDVFAVPEFRTLWLAHVTSVAGDQLARVAMAVLVFDRTHSPAWAALTYAVTFLPDLVGGSVLAGVADRRPRRTVMVVADVARAVLVLALALPGLDLAVQLGVLFGVQLLAVPFTAARTAVLPEILDGDRYRVGSTVISGTYQLALTIGFGGGAAVVAVMGTQAALEVDAVTFVLSAGLIAVGLSSHPPLGDQPRRRGVWWTSLRSGISAIAAHRRARVLLAMACLCGFYVVPEGLAVPYAAEIGVGTSGVAWLLVANPIGSVLGILLLNKVRPDRRLWLLGPLAVATCVVLLPTAVTPGLAVTVVLWTVSGAASAHDAVTAAEFGVTVPEHVRGQAVGLAVAALRAAQGLGIALAGLIAQVLPTSLVIGLAAVAGVVVGLPVALAWARTGSDKPAQTS